MLSRSCATRRWRRELLKSTEQQKIEVQPTPPAAQGSAQPSVQQTVIIQPAQPNTVYVPQYNPTTAYGAPVPAPAGYSGSDLLLTGVLSFGAGILLGSLINNGNNNWGCNWYGGGSGYHSSVKYNNNVYVTNNNVYPGTLSWWRRGLPAAGVSPAQWKLSAPRIPATTGALSGHQACLQWWRRNQSVLATREFPRRGRTTRRRARPANPNIAKPNFPKASTLPNNPGGSNLKNKDLAKNRPNQPA